MLQYAPVSPILSLCNCSLHLSAKHKNGLHPQAYLRCLTRVQIGRKGKAAIKAIHDRKDLRIKSGNDNCIPALRGHGFRRLGASHAIGLAGTLRRRLTEPKAWARLLTWCPALARPAPWPPPRKCAIWSALAKTGRARATQSRQSLLPSRYGVSSRTRSACAICISATGSLRQAIRAAQPPHSVGTGDRPETYQELLALANSSCPWPTGNHPWHNRRRHRVGLRKEPVPHLRPACRIFGQRRSVPLAGMEHDRAGLEDSNFSVCQPGHLSNRLDGQTGLGSVDGGGRDDLAAGRIGILMHRLIAVAPEKGIRLRGWCALRKGRERARAHGGQDDQSPPDCGHGYCRIWPE